MIQIQDPLVLGRPHFSEPTVERTATEEGFLEAWRCALALGPRKAAALAEGEFAVAIAEPGGRVFLAVDRFSIHTLCYRVSDGTLRFARRADELSEGAAIDPQALFDYLYFHVIPSPRTIFQGVFRLPPGHYALWENGRVEVQPYWTPTFEDSAQWSMDSAKVEFRRLLRGAVAGQLDNSKPACFLSGGTDSSSVAGLIGEVTGRAAATYSIGFDAEGYDEMEFARLTARHFHTHHHQYYITPQDVVAGVPAVSGHYDQPFGNSSALPAYYCARMAREDGVSRLLAGDGGDELFGGNTRYAKQRVFGWYEAIPESIRDKFVEPLLTAPGTVNIPGLGKAASYVKQARVPMPERLHTYNLLERIGEEQVLEAGFLAAVDREDPLRQQRGVWSAARTSNLVNRMLAYDWRYTLAESDLPKVRGTAELASVSVGFPFLDSALLELALWLPPHAKLRGLKLRWFFKEALRGFLPDRTLSKRKHGFGLPFGPWAMRHGELRSLVDDSLHSLGTRGIVKPAFVRRLLEEYLPSHPGYYGEMVWILLILEQWLRQHRPSLQFPD